MPSMMNESVTLMGLGMGTVFVFLAVLVVGTMVMSKIVGAMGTDAPEANVRANAPKTNQNELAEVAAVAAAAYAKHTQ